MWDAEICPGFPPPQAALVTVASGEKELWVVWCNSGEVWFKGQGRAKWEYNKYVKVMVGGGQCSSIIGVWWW